MVELCGERQDTYRWFFSSPSEGTFECGRG